MKKWITRIIIISVLAVGAVLLIVNRNNWELSIPNTTEHELINVDAPEANDLIESPLVIRGEARGNWYFEASFPIRLLDGNGKEIAVTIAQAQGDWMTTDFVPFETKIVFTNPATATGTLVFQKDNPSGLPENDDELRIPVRFTPGEGNLQTVLLYYYNEANDKDENGNILCSSQGLVTVPRQIPVTITPIQDTVKLLLKGELSSLEEGLGVGTEFPLAGVALQSASLAQNGALTLTFSDPQNKTGGGSCRVNILRAQIEATAKQFDVVKQVIIAPEDLFQP